MLINPMQLPPQAPLGTNPFVLSEEENKEVFNELILPAFLEENKNNLVAQDRPFFSIITAPPGSGKTTMAKQYGKILGRPAVIFSSDLFRKFHPHYETICAEHEKDRIRLTLPDSQQWSKRMTTYLITRRYNVIREHTQSIYDYFGIAKSISGYETECIFLGVDKKVAFTGAMTRYEEEKSRTGQGFFCPYATFIEIYNEFSSNICQMAENPNVDSFKVYTRDFKNPFFAATQGVSGLELLQKVVEARKLSLDAEPPEKLMKDWDKIITSMRRRNAFRDEVAYISQLGGSILFENEFDFLDYKQIPGLNQRGQQERQ